MIQEYFEGATIYRSCHVWDHHNNTFEKHTVAAGITKHYCQPDNLSLDEYILFAGMVQSEMLGYSLESFRFKDYCWGGLFWMYNDTWGEVGWTIIDYYLRRKISFYGVKRAFEPVKIILRKIGNRVVAVGCNDTGEDVVSQAKAGYISLDGEVNKTSDICLNLPKRSRTRLFEMGLPNEDYSKGIFAVIPEKISPVYLRTCDKRQLNIPKGTAEVLSTEKDGNDLLVTVFSKTFAHGVYFEGTADYSDNYFDLLPGMKKTVRIRNSFDEPCLKQVISN